MIRITTKIVPRGDGEKDVQFESSVPMHLILRGGSFEKKCPYNFIHTIPERQMAGIETIEIEIKE